MAITIEFLKGMGLDDEAIKGIMAERGKEVEKSKAELEAINSQAKVTKENLETLTKEAEALKGEKVTSEEFKQKYEELAEQIKKQSEEAEKLKADEVLTNAIVEAFGEKKDNFSSDYVRSGIIGDMKAEIAKSENKGKGYSEIFEALTKDKEGIFRNANPPGIPPMGRVDGTFGDDMMRSVMGLGAKKD